MKRCPNCGLAYPDENIYFCLSDGTPLVSDESEVPTVISRAPFINQPVQPVRRGISPFVVLAIGFFALVAGGTIVVAFFKFASNTTSVGKNELTNSNLNAPGSNQNKEHDLLNQQKANLQDEQTALEKEKQKLADDRRKLEAQKNDSNKQASLNQTGSQDNSTTRIKFSRGNVGETVSGSINSERSFVLYTLSGQYLSATISSGGGCVVFSNGATSLSYTTNRGDSFLRLKNNCSNQANFSLTVYVR